MPSPTLSREDAERSMSALAEMDGNITAAAEKLGIARQTMQSRIKRAEELFNLSRLTDAGYDIQEAEETPQQAWDAGVQSFNRTISKQINSQWQRIKRPKGPFVLFHLTDPHVDADGSALQLIERDIQDSHNLGAVMCHGGDLLNNWPMAGRLAQQWAQQDCTMARGLLRAQRYIELMKPDAWVDGNHEEMNPYLVDLFKQWLPKTTVTDYWRVSFVVETPGGRDVRCVLAHKFQKGGSWFHKTHGHIREMLEAEMADVFMDGHLHSAGVAELEFPERGDSGLAVASGGYKLADKWARRISKTRGEVRLRGRAHWIVCDPQAEPDESLCVAYKSARHAEAMLNGLQNLRVV